MIKFSASIVLMLASLALAVTPTPKEIDQSSSWLHQFFPPTANAATFSFTYADKPSSQLLGDWQPLSMTFYDAHNEIHRQIVWSDPHSGLRVTWIGVEYHDFPVVEWTVYFKNAGPTDTPILSNLQAIDLPLPAPGDLTLHHNVGGLAIPTDYQPLTDLLKPGQSKKITTAGGRSTNTDLPFFNLEHDGGGTIIALGWPGQWASQFTRDLQSIRITAGQELTHLTLHPGESVRTPLVAMLSYHGDSDRGQNLWRQWMLAYNLPKTADGKPPAPMSAGCSSHQFGEMIHADEASQILFIDRYLQEGIKIDYWWMDAGWYVNNGGWPNTGTWEVDPKRFPHGLRAISDHAHSKSVKTLVWFEPERVTPSTWLYDNHPEWLLGKAGDQKLLNLGSDDARKWWVDHADSLLRDQGIDLYRTDYNIDPLPYWRAADAPDRQGITENKYVVGLLAYFDELHHRHPGMLIDTCASGGRRNDLEVLRRAVPLLRSDYIMEPIGQQNHTFGISSWIPYFGTGLESADPYVFRSQMTPWLILCFDVRRTDWDYASIRKLWSQWKSLSQFWSGDYYPRTPYNPAPTAWLAWQFNLPAQNQGMIQAFRRPEAKEASIQVKLKDLNPTQTYEVTDLDTATPKTFTGKELMETGLEITRAQKPAAIVLTYKPLK
jgi:alpha-galactosidase